MSAEKFFTLIDWELLGKQKVTLLDVIAVNADAPEGVVENLDGILHLLDALQDFAADEYGLTTHFPAEEYPSVGTCIYCHRRLFDQYGPTLVDNTGGDICDANYGHCRGFSSDADGENPDICNECMCHRQDHP